VLRHNLGWMGKKRDILHGGTLLEHTRVAGLNHTTRSCGRDVHQRVRHYGRAPSNVLDGVRVFESITSCVKLTRATRSPDMCDVISVVTEFMVRA
jgi:hypothetical protein